MLTIKYKNYLSMAALDNAICEFTKEFGHKPTTLVINPLNEMTAKHILLALAKIDEQGYFKSGIALLSSISLKENYWSIRDSKNEWGSDPE